jgi:hypothetical protein
VGRPQSGAKRKMNWGNASFISGTGHERDDEK